MNKGRFKDPWSSDNQVEPTGGSLPFFFAAVKSFDAYIAIIVLNEKNWIQIAPFHNSDIYCSVYTDDMVCSAARGGECE